MKKLLLVLLFCQLAGCARMQTYQGNPLDDQKIGLIYDTRSFLTMSSIDGKPADYTMAKVLEMKPGKHDFVLAWDGTFLPANLVGVALSNPGKGSLYIKISLDVKPGYSYTLLAFEKGKRIVGGRGVPDQACFYGEPHDAPGSSVGFTGEERFPSATVQKAACVDVTH